MFVIRVVLCVNFISVVLKVAVPFPWRWSGDEALEGPEGKKFWGGFWEYGLGRKKQYLKKSLEITDLLDNHLSYSKPNFDIPQMQGLSTSQKSDYMKLANDVTEMIRGSSLDDPEYTKLKGDLTSFRKLISHIKPGLCFYLIKLHSDCKIGINKN